MQVKDQLNKAKSATSVTPLEAREAMLGCFVTIHWVFRTNVTAGFGIVTEDFGPS